LADAGDTLQHVVRVRTLVLAGDRLIEPREMMVEAGVVGEVELDLKR
jgi:hypothetical protein